MMKVVTDRDFQKQTADFVGSGDVILITRDGAPAGLYIPFGSESLPLELRRRVFAQVAEAVRVEREAAGVTEEEVLADFAATRRDHRGR